MSTTWPPIMVGVYETETQAKNAVEKLQQAGFADQQIGMVMRKGLLMPHQVLHDLISIGIPEEEAVIYEGEYQAGHIIVLVRHDGRIQEAFKSLYNMTFTLSVAAQKKPEGPDECLHDAADSSSSSSQEDEQHSLWKILKDAGLDHLL